MGHVNLQKQSGLTQARLKELLHYDPLTGKFTNIARRQGTKLGAEVGSLNKVSGYLIICIDYKHFYAQRVAWLYMTGEWPEDEVDHENGVRSDNRWKNLRPATRAEQMQNLSKRSNACGFIGVFVDKQKFAARIATGGKRYNLGNFPTAAEAHAAYLAAKARLHPFQPIPRDVRT